MGPRIGAVGAADMKGPGSPPAAICPNTPPSNPEKRFDDEMHHVVRQVGIETRRGSITRVGADARSIRIA